MAKLRVATLGSETSIHGTGRLRHSWLADIHREQGLTVFVWKWIVYGRRRSHASVNGSARTRAQALREVVAILRARGHVVEGA